MANHPLKFVPPDWPAAWRDNSPPGHGVPLAPRSGGRELIRPSAVARVEAVLMVADGPLTARRIAQHAMLPDAKDARDAIAWLNAAYDQDQTPFRVEQIAAGYRLLTRSQLAPWLNRLHRAPGGISLSSPALETLTIVAYRQPCTRADVDAIRGVQSAEMLKYLMERGLIRITGEHDSLGRPYIYETTKTFLEVFGFKTLADLPRAAELRPNKAN